MAKPADTNDKLYEIENFVGRSTQADVFGSVVPPDNSIKFLTSSKFPVNFPQEEKKSMVYNIIWGMLSKNGSTQLMSLA